MDSDLSLPYYRPILGLKSIEDAETRTLDLSVHYI